MCCSFFVRVICRTHDLSAVRNNSQTSGPGILLQSLQQNLAIQIENSSVMKSSPSGIPTFRDAVHRLQLFWFCLFLFTGFDGVKAEDPPEPKWEPVEIDRIEIGYGLQLEDVNGDGKRDIVLADKKTIQWYEAPNWKKHVIAMDLTKRDNVCVTARDTDGDGKCEIAVGGQWNFRETIKDGAVFYLKAGEDRTTPWKPIELHHEPSVHRMHWIKAKSGFQLLVKPLRGRGSQNGDGPGLRLLSYANPQAGLDSEFKVVCDQLHLSHNFHPVNWDSDPEEEIIVAAKEGVWHFDGSGVSDEENWTATQLTSDFAGEIRDGRLPSGRRFIVAIQPMHGSSCAVYMEPSRSINSAGT